MGKLADLKKKLDRSRGSGDGPDSGQSSDARAERRDELDRSVKRAPPVDPAKYTELRNHILALHTQEIEVEPAPTEPPLLGVVMELGGLNETVTIAALVDGTTSLYVSNGFLVLGAGEYPRVRAAGEAFIAVAVDCLSQLAESDDCSLPESGHVRFHVLTVEGRRSADFVLMDLKAETHSFHRLAEAGFGVKSQIDQVIARVERQRSAGQNGGR